MRDDLITIGTCSWKYPSWERIVYTGHEGINFLSEYARKYDTVEIDQWFYRLPEAATVRGYVESVPSSFTFAIKAPRQITLRTSHDFLSIDLFNHFYTRLEPMQNQIETIMFEFEYMNKNKMSGYEEFNQRVGNFMNNLPRDICFAFEPRNPQFLTQEYFDLLTRHEMYHVFSEKIYMPPIAEIYSRFRNSIIDKTYIRLLGGDRKKIEAKTGNQWNQIVEPKDRELMNIAEMAHDLVNRRIKTAFYVNNHFEGSAPLSIEKFLTFFETRR